MTRDPRDPDTTVVALEQDACPSCGRVIVVDLASPIPVVMHRDPVCPAFERLTTTQFMAQLGNGMRGEGRS